MREMSQDQAMPMTQGTVPGADLGPQTGLVQQAAPGQLGGQVPTADAMQALAAAAMQAAQSASQAVVQMHALQERQASDRNFTGYSDASKVLKYPEGFGGNESHESDVAKWQEFYYSFKSWLLYAEIEYSSELDTIEANLNVIVSVGDMLEATKGRARRLYAILSGLLKGMPLVMLRAVEPSNGFELWRQLVSVYAPRTRARGLALLSAFMGYPGFTKDRSFR